MKRKIMMLRMLFSKLFGGGYKVAELCKKEQYFKSQGEHCYFCIWNFGTEPHLISFGNNVHIASKVTFINHDVTFLMFNYMEKDKTYKGKTGTITIGDNVFIGTNSTILYDVKIGNNVIIGAGSIVTKDIPDGVVAVGAPCRVIGSFDDYKAKLEYKEAE